MLLVGGLTGGLSVILDSADLLLTAVYVGAAVLAATGLFWLTEAIDLLADLGVRSPVEYDDYLRGYDAAREFLGGKGR